MHGLYYYSPVAVPRPRPPAPTWGPHLHTSRNWQQQQQQASLETALCDMQAVDKCRRNALRALDDALQRGDFSPASMARVEGLCLALSGSTADALSRHDAREDINVGCMNATIHLNALREQWRHDATAASLINSALKAALGSLKVEDCASLAPVARRSLQRTERGSSHRSCTAAALGCGFGREPRNLSVAARRATGNDPHETEMAPLAESTVLVNVSQLVQHQEDYCQERDGILSRPAESLEVFRLKNEAPALSHEIDYIAGQGCFGRFAAEWRRAPAGTVDRNHLAVIAQTCLANRYCAQQILQSFDVTL